MAGFWKLVSGAASQTPRDSPSPDRPSQRRADGNSNKESRFVDRSFLFALEHLAKRTASLASATRTVKRLPGDLVSVMRQRLTDLPELRRTLSQRFGLDPGRRCCA